jgi:hypothetical protein
MAWNLASALNLATLNCFLQRQVTRFPPTRVQYTEVDLRSMTNPAQFAYVQASTFR